MAGPTPATSSTPSGSLFITDTSGSSLGNPATPNRSNMTLAPLVQRRMSDETKVKLWGLVNLVAAFAVGLFLVVELIKPSDYLNTFKFGSVVTISGFALITRMLGLQNISIGSQEILPV